MIQWCEDCKYSFETDNYDCMYCQKCLECSKPGKKPAGYKQENMETEKLEHENMGSDI